MTARKRKPRIAVWKFASCDGCQLSLLDCEDEFLAVADAVEIAYFMEATRGRISRALAAGAALAAIRATAAHAVVQVMTGPPYQ